MKVAADVFLPVVDATDDFGAVGQPRRCGLRGGAVGADMELAQVVGQESELLGGPHPLRHGRHAVCGHKTLGKTKMAEECCRNNALHLKVFLQRDTEARAQVLALEWARRMQYFIDLAVMNHGRAGELSHAEKELQTFSRVCGARVPRADLPTLLRKFVR